MEKIPVCMIEEHHEAFYAWSCFIERGMIPKKDNYLLHVDHHDDMESGGYAWDFSAFPQTLEERRRFTYEVLGIADFIIPAIYGEMFSKVHIVKNLMPLNSITEEMVIQCTYGTELTQRKMIPFLHAEHKRNQNPAYHFYTKIENGLTPLTIEGSIVLDIDLDYFCWDDSLETVPPKRMELTKEAYSEYVQNPYHPFRIIPKKLLHPVEEKGRFYIEYKENVKPGNRVTEERIKKRIRRFCDWLSENSIRPAAIDICRSRNSGYLPSYADPFVENTLMKHLGELWDLEPFVMKGAESNGHIAELLHKKKEEI